ncbi:hypothetical protein ColLi_10948 [Colletotrichum liriopes]|uniref:PD-(D/E)XK nuclease-like domain-containing protein n=1 Tax=Colletotrichum liriopes TaxID=708192 RepID=A0AA37GWR6_9PEZI|nr:hypothetical protein ColLi_10948 [Colletotrichum liriopes]
MPSQTLCHYMASKTITNIITLLIYAVQDVVSSASHMLPLHRNHDTDVWAGFNSVETWLYQVSSNEEHEHHHSDKLAMQYNTPTKSNDTNLDPYKTPQARGTSPFISSALPSRPVPPLANLTNPLVGSARWSLPTEFRQFLLLRLEPFLRPPLGNHQSNQDRELTEARRNVPLTPHRHLDSSEGSRRPLKTLLKDLGSYEQVRGVIPSGMRERIEQHEDITNGPYPEWYTETTAPQSVLEWEYQRLVHISEKSVECMERLDYEAGWNDRVHAPLLEVALETPAQASFPDIFFRNITASLISSDVLKQDAVLKDTKVDYGIFIQPVGPDDELSVLIDDYIRVNPAANMTHTTLPDKPKTPLAISIETKSLSAKLNSGPAQLALWLRAQYQHLSQFACAAGASTDCALPTMPIILVLGDTWRVLFARRTADSLPAPPGRLGKIRL